MTPSTTDFVYIAVVFCKENNKVIATYYTFRLASVLEIYSCNEYLEKVSTAIRTHNAVCIEPQNLVIEFSKKYLIP